MANLFNTMLLGKASPPIPGLVLWLDATQTPIGSVSSWTDLSGNGNHATQGTALKQPVCTATQLNGERTLLFASATSQTLILPSALYTIPNGNSTTFVVAARVAETGGAYALIDGGQSGVALRYDLRFSATAGSIEFRNGTSSVVRNGGTNTNYQILMDRRSGTTQAAAINHGAEASDTNAVSGNTIDYITIGSNNNLTVFLNGGIAEILMYNSSLSASQVTLVAQYLSQKWGIAIS